VIRVIRVIRVQLTLKYLTRRSLKAVTRDNLGEIYVIENNAR